MESELFKELAGLDGHDKELNLAEYRDLHTYVEQPIDYGIALYDERRILNHAHFYELDETENESLEDKLYHLHRLIIQEIIDFCQRNKLSPDYVSLSADRLLDSISEGSWMAGTDSCLCFQDEDGEIIIESL